ncbi:alpha/beta hydrolase [Emticicia oligotrophica]|nr:alpha/beta hydrolase-fold protein [Emticicia oligotrophica]
MNAIINILLFCFFALNTYAQVVSSGRLERQTNFQSKYVAARNVDVWLPKNYDGKSKFSVLYMHDGQMLFDAASTWNKQAWDVDDIMTKLLDEKAIQNCIVVGIWNIAANRHSDYFPQKPFEMLSQAQQDSIYKATRGKNQALFAGKINSDNYLKFIVEELKPFIDKKYAVFTDQKHTFIGGSSMGGLISMYAICEYPKVFAGAACLSTHWVGTFTVENNPIPATFLQYLQIHLPSPKNHKIYFDYGTETLDALYKPFQEKVDIVMKSKGFSDKNWLTKEFIGADHSEKSWNQRLDIPLKFLLNK